MDEILIFHQNKCFVSSPSSYTHIQFLTLLTSLHKVKSGKYDIQGTAASKIISPARGCFASTRYTVYGRS